MSGDRGGIVRRKCYDYIYSFIQPQKIQVDLYIVVVGIMSLYRFSLFVFSFNLYGGYSVIENSRIGIFSYMGMFFTSFCYFYGTDTPPVPNCEAVRSDPLPL